MAGIALALCLASPVLADDAFDAHMRAAQSGSAAAQADVAYAYAKGIGVAADNGQAARWYQKSVDQGYLPAYSRLAGLYYFGEGGVARDVPRVLALLNAGADRQDGPCLFLLGAFYEEGEIVPRDYGKAAAYYQAAVDRHEPAAFSNLAGLYERGEGVPRDPARARQLREDGAALGNAGAADWLSPQP